MKFVNHSVERIEEKDVFKKIELCGRVAYKSEDKISDSSAIKFVENIVKLNHGAVLEHGNIILKVSDSDYDRLHILIRSQYFHFSSLKGRNIVSGNVRAFIDLFNERPAITGWLAKSIINSKPEYSILFSNIKGLNLDHSTTMDEFYIINENELQPGVETEIHKRITYKFTTNRAMSHEIVRHRLMSFTQESTRYCNYSKGKFDSATTYCIPHWCKSIKPGLSSVGYSYTPREEVFINGLVAAEQTYFELLELGEKPEDARDILPNDLKTEIIVTGNIKDWKHFLELRLPKSAHPQIRILAKQINLEQ